MQKKLDFSELTTEEMLSNSREFFATISKRRTVRDFSDRAVDLEVIENAIRAAGSAPSGANKQPWHYVIVSNPQVNAKFALPPKPRRKSFITGAHRKPGWMISKCLKRMSTNLFWRQRLI